MATYNSRTITLKIDAVDRLDYKNNWKYSEIETKFKSDTFEAVINSVNPIRKEYDLTPEDIEYILEKRAEVKSIMADVIHLLKSKKGV